MGKTIDESKTAAWYALGIGMNATSFHSLLRAKKLILAALSDLEDIPDQEADKLALQLSALLGQVDEAINEARGIVCDEPDSDSDVSHRTGARV